MVASAAVLIGGAWFLVPSVLVEVRGAAVLLEVAEVLVTELGVVHQAFPHSVDLLLVDLRLF